MRRSGASAKKAVASAIQTGNDLFLEWRKLIISSSDANCIMTAPKHRHYPLFSRRCRIVGAVTTQNKCPDRELKSSRGYDVSGMRCRTAVKTGPNGSRISAEQINWSLCRPMRSSSSSSSSSSLLGLDRWIVYQIFICWHTFGLWSTSPFFVVAEY